MLRTEYIKYFLNYKYKSIVEKIRTKVVSVATRLVFTRKGT